MNKCIETTKDVGQAVSIYINNIVYVMKKREVDMITLSLGEAFFQIPKFPFDELDFESGYHYSESMGLPLLREKISQYYINKDIKVDAREEVLITAGSKIAIYMVIKLLATQGDEVIIHEPAWLSYKEQIKLAGAETVEIPYYDTIDNIKDYINDRTKLIILNNPSNPAGIIYSMDDLRKLLNICREKGIYLLLDEAYSEFVCGEDFKSALELDTNKDNIIVVNSFSKNFGMSGWRIGYIVSNSEIISQLLKINQHLITCAPTILQMYLAKYFDEISKLSFNQARMITAKRNEVYKISKELGLNAIDGCATFYMFISLEDYPYSSLQFSLYLIYKYNIATVPGSAYGNTTSRFIRIGVGVEDIDRIKKALVTIKRVIDEKEFDETIIKNKMKEYDVKELD